MSGQGWEPKTGEWVAVRNEDASRPWTHVRVIKRTAKTASVEQCGTRVYRQNRHGEWFNKVSYIVNVIMPATRPQAELEAEFMRELRENERRRMKRECEAAVLTAYERGDDDAIRRAIHELEKGTKP